MIEQRIPRYTPVDFERVLSREFPDNAAEARRILETIASGGDHVAELRIRMACLKLARGNMDELTGAVQAARADPRDVIAWAEYGRTMNAGDPKARETAAEDDWRELQEWLARPSQ